jgi:NADH dehydrogenase
VSNRVLVTGANGRLGRRLLLALAARGDGPRALVRSRIAADSLARASSAHAIEVWTADYADPAAIAEAATGCTHVVHLVGILKESPTSRYVDAHERATRAVTLAAEHAGARRVVTVSILGTDAESRNPCLASKGRAERILLEGKVPATVLRVPMVLGPGEHAAAALRRRARARVAFLVAGGSSLEQPLDADDLLRAVCLAVDDESGAHRVLDLGGPESLPRRELLLRAAALLGRTPRIVSIPRGLARFAARLLGLLPSRPLTLPMLDVLERDDRVDPAPACRALGLELTPLERTLRVVLEVPSGR